MLAPEGATLPAEAPRGPASAPRPVRALLRLALLAAGLAGAVLAVRLLGPGLLGGRFGGAAAPASAGGLLGFSALATLACAVGLPRQAVCFAAGVAFGPLGGTLLAEAATLAACLVDFLWARWVARDWARRRLLGRTRRLAELDRLLERETFTAVLTLRLLPVGNSLMLSMLAGLSRARLVPFLAATALGALPQTVVFALLGSGVAVGHAARIVLAVALFAASAVLGLLLMRRRSATLAVAE